MKEQTLIEQVKAYLGKIPNLFFWKEHGGIYGTAGIPDIIICYKGKFIGLECKAEGRKPTILQQIAIKKIIKSGGIAQIVYSLDDVREILSKFR